MVQSISEIRGIGPSTLEDLESEGIVSLRDLAQANPEELSEGIGTSESRARKMITKAKQSTVIIQSGTEVQEEQESKSVIPSGIPELDDAIGGGWEEGFIVAFAGTTGTAKTQLSFKSLVNAVEETGKPAVYIETERGRYRPERLRQLATQEGTQDLIYRIKAYDLDQQENAYGAVRDNFDDLSLVVVDSFTARFRLSDEFDGRGTLSERSSVMGRHLTKLEKIAEDMQVPILMTAQIYENPGQYGKGEYVYGGSLFQHTVSFFMRMSNGQGDLINAEVKNHPGQGEAQINLKVSDDITAVED